MIKNFLKLIAFTVLITGILHLLLKPEYVNPVVILFLLTICLVIFQPQERSYMKTILEQDDCAPDSLEFFDKKFKEIVGETRQDFIKSATHVVIGSEGINVYFKNGYELVKSADHPYWKLNVNILNRN